ncbi:hypothetical protein GO732_02960 [Gordonibacter sp. ResAG-26]|uniref:Uncharacterized protein n=1 Tax=Gordonibacter urolithinfaciens TaxID=1335613 RepID=A0A6N8ILN7_9ACTN|nr:hypothetical protein [Gordonibacter urolithinfaciens]MVN15753.1 hypothetical protein [Gordonibacter urolithinfaciens]MVN39314.1 hypothetical protein [Gordonibacter urolithinfaciens]MVN54873.1 hypothetical protein [Gordonibacter urolithinfaciens]MVN60223.1 hypothetical protein [Gordonibacter urolithinfaciens]
MLARAHALCGPVALLFARPRCAVACGRADSSAGPLLRFADAADRAAAHGARALRDGLAVLRGTGHGVSHDLLLLALHAVCLDRHGWSPLLGK